MNPEPLLLVENTAGTNPFTFSLRERLPKNCYLELLEMVFNAPVTDEILWKLEIDCNKAQPRILGNGTKNHIIPIFFPASNTSRFYRQCPAGRYRFQAGQETRFTFTISSTIGTASPLFTSYAMLFKIVPEQDPDRVRMNMQTHPQGILRRKEEALTEENTS